MGAGILFLNGGSPTIRNCTFVDNRCTFGGAACYINGAGATFIDCTFEGNDGGSFGGAIDIATGLPVQFDRCTFRGNTAARAGALEIFSTQGVTVSNSLFVDNLANASDGGGGLWIGSGSTADLSGCTIVANRAPNSTVGGLRQLTSTVTAVNCIFWDNVGQGRIEPTTSTGGSEESRRVHHLQVRVRTGPPDPEWEPDGAVVTAFTPR